MVDYIKFQLNNVPEDFYFKNLNLEFKTYVDRNTGELSKKSLAYYKGLKVEVFHPTEFCPNGRITIGGSVHKYWNNGVHNVNDFNLIDFRNAMSQIQIEIGISIYDCRLLQLEVGVNLDLTKRSFDSKDIISGLLLHIKKPFKNQYTKSEGSYKICQHNRYLFKVYDKGMHYRNKNPEFNKDILRIEIAFKKMRDLNDNGIFVLNDLLHCDFHLFKRLLLIQWSKVLLFDEKNLKNHKNEYLYSNIKWWGERSDAKFKYHKKILNDKPLKKMLAKVLEAKIDNLIFQKKTSTFNL